LPPLNALISVKPEYSLPEETNISHFRDLNLPANLTKSLEDVGYEVPTPIQAEAIPFLLTGRDLLGHAPTGTGKTAAFALPLLSRIDLSKRQVQLMVLTPTRELAIQVAEALAKYARHLPGFKVLPIYGGQEYGGQIRGLRGGVHAVVGTPGRVMDHMRKGTLKLATLDALVLDEADEMLRMGFIDDVEWILEQMPEKRQMALFSATMPKEVQRIARKFLSDPKEIAIKNKTATASLIRQRFWSVSHGHKLDALTRILEIEEFDAMLIFVRTKIATVELSEKLAARGYSVAPINGDIAQNQREKVIQRFTRGSLDILIATDVAARGLDVSRISHVVNYDIPYDTEAYIHRIGRTGRAGRQGDAILFVTPREHRMLAAIEKATRQKIEKLELPTTEMVNNKRIADFKQKISDVLAEGKLEFLKGMIEQYQLEHDTAATDIAAALAKLHMGEQFLLSKDKAKNTLRSANTGLSRKSNQRPERNRGKQKSRSGKKADTRVPDGMERYRIEVGHQHEVKPSNIVGALANESGLDGDHIGHIDIHDDHCFVDLPEGMSRQMFFDLKKVWVCGQKLNITRAESDQDKHLPAFARAKPGRSKKPKRGKSQTSKTAKRKAGKAAGRKKNSDKS
jgi:ATP-dependent RNA helicase DeaD